MSKHITVILLVVLVSFLVSGCSAGNLSPVENAVNTTPVETLVLEETGVIHPTGFSGSLIYVMDFVLYIHDLGTGITRPIESTSQFLERESAGAYLSISPDRRYLAFNGIDPLFGCPTYNTDQTCVLTGPDGYFLVDLRTEEVTLIAPYALSNLSWEPRGNRFVFASIEYVREPYQTALKITSPEGGEAFYLTQGENVDAFPAWSPTGEWIAFLRSPSPLPDQPQCESESQVYDTCSDPSLYIIHPDGTGLTLVGEHIRLLNSAYNAPAWSPDGKQLVVITGQNANEITLINLDSGQETSVASLYPVIQTPVWSPDSSALLFVSQQTGDREIFSVNPDGSNPVNLSQHSSADDYPVWSPAGDGIVYVTQRSSVRRTLILQPVSPPGRLYEYNEINTRFLPLWVTGTLP